MLSWWGVWNCGFWPDTSERTLGQPPELGVLWGLVELGTKGQVLREWGIYGLGTGVNSGFGGGPRALDQRGPVPLTACSDTRWGRLCGTTDDVPSPLDGSGGCI